MTLTFRTASRVTMRLALVLVVLTALTGCAGAAPSSSEVERETVALVISPTTGAPELPMAELDAELSRLDSEGDRLIVVVADGEPFVAIDLTLQELPGNSDDRDDVLKRLRADAATAISIQEARTPEADVVEAIALAAQSVDPASRTTIIVTGSGLQTTGALSMLDGRLYAEPTDLVESAGNDGQFPDLSAVAQIRMPRLGVTTAPQPALDHDARTALTAVWEEYLSRTDVASVSLIPTDLRAGDPVTSAPVVSPVDVRRPVAEPVHGCRQMLGTATIGFAAGSAEFADRKAAMGVVRAAHDDLAGCAGVWLVEGSASSEGGSGNRALSLARAENVAELLRSVEPGAEIEVVGWGDEWPCRLPDVDAHGALILDAAIANRAVVISRGADSC